jgi:hypothetical protein
VTTGWDALTDAIKIGVPSLLTGLTAFFIARGSRLHELDKERRRRRLDFLEALGDHLDDFENKLADVRVTCIEAFQPEGTSEAKSKFLLEYESCCEAGRKLDNLETRLKMMGFPECVASNEQMRRASMSVHDEIEKCRTNFYEARVGIALDRFEDEAAKFREVLASAYATL